MHPDTITTPSSASKYAGLVSFIGAELSLAVVVRTSAMMIFFAMRGADMTTPFIQTILEAGCRLAICRIDLAFQLDQLSILMVLIITGVGTLIHLFSVGYMKEDPGYARYFAYLNLFVFFMLILVLGANYPVLFIGWEGVGLCSYLLIGFWFSEKANAQDAGKKAFIVEPDPATLGYWSRCLCCSPISGRWTLPGSLASASLMPFGGPFVTTICLLHGTSWGAPVRAAQIPLYVWLPDAMAESNTGLRTDPRRYDGGRRACILFARSWIPLLHVAHRLL